MLTALCRPGWVGQEEQWQETCALCDEGVSCARERGEGNGVQRSKRDEEAEWRQYSLNGVARDPDCDRGTTLRVKIAA